MDMLRKITDFMTDIGIHPSLSDIGKISWDFAAEMERGLAGGGGSLKMLPTYIPSAPPPVSGEPVIALDAGGTNFRRALVEFRDGVPRVENLQTTRMPGRAGEITLGDFLDFIREQIGTLLAESRRIGLCFSYAFDSTPELDGRIISLSKEVRISGINGILLGEALRGALRGDAPDLRFAMINDAAASLLGGAAECGSRGPAAGLIIGTGLNMAYTERGAAIKKLPDAHDMIVNMEAGGFDPLPLGEPDKLLDARTKKPGEHPLEKMVSGAYVGEVVLEALRLAASSGLLSEAAMRDISQRRSMPMRETDRLLGIEAPLGGSADDALVIKTIIASIYERSARLVCAMLRAVCERAGERLFLTVDGSVFYKSHAFREALLRLIAENGLDIEHQKAENGNLTGAALAALA